MVEDSPDDPGEEKSEDEVADDPGTARLGAAAGIRIRE